MSEDAGEGRSHTGEVGEIKAWEGPGSSSRAPTPACPPITPPAAPTPSTLQKASFLLAPPIPHCPAALGNISPGLSPAQASLNWKPNKITPLGPSPWMSPRYLTHHTTLTSTLPPKPLLLPYSHLRACSTHPFLQGSDTKSCLSHLLAPTESLLSIPRVPGQVEAPSSPAQPQHPGPCLTPSNPFPKAQT